MTEARARYQQALDLARALPPSENGWRAQIEAILKLASVAQNRAHFEQDLSNLKQARSFAEAINDRASLCQIQYWIGRINYVLGRFDLGVEYAGKALLIAEGLGGDDRYSADPVNLLGRIHCLRGEPREAIAYSARNVAQMKRLGNVIEEAAMSGVLAFAYGMHGEFDKAFESAAHGVELARQVEHLPTQAACIFFFGVARGWHGDLDEALPHFEQAYAICEKSGDVFRKYLIHGWRGQACLLAGSWEAARRDLDRCLVLGDEIGTAFHRGGFQALRAKLHLLDDDVGAALRDSTEALKVASETGQDWGRSIALQIHAEALLAIRPARFEQAEKEILSAIDIQEHRECRFDLAWSRLALGFLHAALGRRDQAREAYGIADQMFARMSLKPGQIVVARAIEALGAVNVRQA